MCGIAGIISPKRKKFDYSTFCTLGIHNDTRGGDSVGIFIDGKSEYYCKGANQSLFEDFIETSKLLEETTEAQIAYLHCRKTSVGNTSLESAQPVILNDKDGNPEFVLMHNGTIYNYEDLAKKYIPEINIKGLTDSQVMARIFYHAGYQALSEYNGGAVFAIIDYRGETPEYLFWQGHSKQYTSSANEEPERPLYFAQGDDGELVFSSLPQFFPALKKGYDIFTVLPNTLCEYTTDMYVKEEYSRKNCISSKAVNYSSNARNTTHTNYNTNSYNYNTGSTSYNTNTTSTSISYSKHLYYRCGKPMHGLYKISDYGTIFEHPTTLANNDIYFYYGTIVKNEEAFRYLEMFAKNLGFKPEELYEFNAELIKYLSPYPLLYETNKNGMVHVKHIVSPVGGCDFTGEVYIPFTQSKAIYDNGVFQRQCYCANSDCLDAWKMHKDDKLDLEVLLTV